MHDLNLEALRTNNRGNIKLTLKECGLPLPKGIRYNVWDWDRR